MTKKKILKKVLLVLLISTSLILLKFLITFTTNELIISNYDKGKYDTGLVNTLYFLNLSEPYIAYYNHGNLLYQNGDYQDAINKYEKALEKKPSANKVCSIRINLALAITATIDETDKEEALKKLKQARETLYEDNCAHEQDDNGDSQEAEELEQELKDLEKEANGEEDNSDDKESNDSKDDNNQEENQTIEEQLKEIQKNSSSSRQEDIDYYNSDISYYDGKSW